MSGLLMATPVNMNSSEQHPEVALCASSEGQIGVGCVGYIQECIR